MPPYARVEVKGLKELRASVRHMDRATLRLIQGVTRAGAQVVATEARGLAPRRTGRLGSSIVASTQGTSGIVRSPLPYAKVHEYGGTIHPRGVPITIQRSSYVGRALDAKAEEVGRTLAEGFDRLARANGWR